MVRPEFIMTFGRLIIMGKPFLLMQNPMLTIGKFPTPWKDFFFSTNSKTILARHFKFPVFNRASLAECPP